MTPKETPSSLVTKDDADDPLSLMALGQRCSDEGDFLSAEGYLRQALAKNHHLPMAHNNLGWARQMQGDTGGAITNYQRALQLNPTLSIAQANLAKLLSDSDRFEEAIPFWNALLTAKPPNRVYLQRAIGYALEAGRIEQAAEYAKQYAILNRGSRWHPPGGEGLCPPAIPTPTPFLTVAKLQHDIEQYQYLLGMGLLPKDFLTIIDNHKRVLDAAASLGEAGRKSLGEAERALIGDVYNRIVYVRPTPQVSGHALSDLWDGSSVENDYFTHPLGLSVVDHFLSEEALEEVRKFCLQSTVWLSNRYAYGRIGAFLRDGFNCPLLLQIADELSRRLPHVIGTKHRLLQLWGFKYNYMQPITSAHADFAAVNVNLWITPEEANLEKDAGGLIVHDTKAPHDWDFRDYNKDGTKIEGLLRQSNSSGFTIPYRGNRAVIFNSDFFHRTARLRFRNGYENRRINITMLYGRRMASAQSVRPLEQDPPAARSPY
jgi:tetratricopeptide (TPR) repeat protein